LCPCGRPLSIHDPFYNLSRGILWVGGDELNQDYHLSDCEDTQESALSFHFDGLVYVYAQVVGIMKDAGDYGMNQEVVGDEMDQDYHLSDYESAPSFHIAGLVHYYIMKENLDGSVV